MLWKKLLACVGVVIVAMAAAPAAHASADLYFNIKAVHSGKCLDVYAGSMEDGAPVHQWTCLGSAQTNQKWKLREYNYGYALVNENSGKCLEVPYGHWENGAQIQQSTCLGAGRHNQIWGFIAKGDGRYMIYNVSMCMDVDGFNMNDYGKIQLWDCKDDSFTNQRWTLSSI